MEQKPDHATPPKEECETHIAAVRDSLYVIGGKWKLPIVSALKDGPLRFGELQKILEDITPKILSKELKELELNEFITRKVYPTTPVTVEYALTEYSRTLGKVVLALSEWGTQHKQRLKECSKARRTIAKSAKTPA